MGLVSKTLSIITTGIKTRSGRKRLTRYVFSRRGLAYIFLACCKVSPKFLKPLFRTVYRFLIKHQVKAAKEAIFRFDALMKEAGIRYWLEYGTLLGAYRTGEFIYEDFILYRFDLDTGIFLSDGTLDEIDTLLTTNGFTPLGEFAFVGEEDQPVERSYVYHGIKLDVFCFFVDESQKQMYSHYFARGGKEVYRQSFPLATRFKTLELYDKPFPIPDNVEDHLAYYYGADYMKPANADWSVFDCPAFTKTDKKGRFIKPVAKAKH